MPDYIVDWEYFLYEAQLNGYQANPLVLSREFLKKARLTENERRWIMLPRPSPPPGHQNAPGGGPPVPIHRVLILF